MSCLNFNFNVTNFHQLWALQVNLRREAAVVPEVEPLQVDLESQGLLVPTCHLLTQEMVGSVNTIGFGLWNSKYRT